MEFSFESDLMEKLVVARTAVACVVHDRGRDAEMLARSRLRLAVSRELLREPVGTLVVRRESS